MPLGMAAGALVAAAVGVLVGARSRCGCAATISPSSRWASPSRCASSPATRSGSPTAPTASRASRARGAARLTPEQFNLLYLAHRRRDRRGRLVHGSSACAARRSAACCARSATTSRWPRSPASTCALFKVKAFAHRRRARSGLAGGALRPLHLVSSRPTSSCRCSRSTSSWRCWRAASATTGAPSLGACPRRLLPRIHPLRHAAGAGRVSRCRAPRCAS